MTPLEKDLRMASAIASRVEEQGGAVYYVGGYVRDKLLGRENKDVDIEVHGVTPAVLEEILDSLGQRLTMGESFGIYGLRGCTLDIAMPRKAENRGQGHADFDAFVDPFVGVETAARRRDFTVNSLMENVLTGEIEDPFGGQQDLKEDVLRHVSDETFREDPLRVLRAAQFAARFGFAVAPQTLALCRSLDLRELAFERVGEELRKALLKAPRPSVFFETLRAMDQLDIWFPELKALIGVEQNEKFHREGDVWNHTMLVLDEAARLKDRVENPFGFLLAALTHDFGKAVTTERINGVIHAYGHEEAGVPLAERFLRRFTRETKLIGYVCNLTEHHMKPNVMVRDRSAVKSSNRLFDSSAEPEALVCLALADDRGRTLMDPREDGEEFLYRRLEIYREYMSRPYVAGRDLLEAGLTPGKEFGELLAFAHRLRLAGVPKEDALKQTLARVRKPK